MRRNSLSRGKGVKMSNQLKVGDIVVLKSGGPQMTVVELDLVINGKFLTECVWFSKEEKLEQGLFNPLILSRKCKQ